jgi:hypothetical protein
VRRTPALLAALSLALGLVGATQGEAASGPLMTFTPATVVDPVLFGGEPGFTFDPTSKDGTQRSFVDWPVTSRLNIGVLFRSEDGGLSYTKRYGSIADTSNAGVACFARQVPYCPAGGGGDTDIDINPSSGTVAMGEQEVLLNQAVGVSLDHGTSFPISHVDPALDKTGTGVDRQWQASWKGTKTRFMGYHVPAIGEFVNRSDNDGALGSWTVAAVPQIQGVTQSGSMLADNTGGPNNHALYIGYLGFPFVNAATGFRVAVSLDGAKTFTSHSVPKSDNARNFTTLSIDSAGNLYATWVDSTKQSTWLSTSKASDPANVGHPATKWSEPVQVSKEPLTVTIFSNTAAGSPGRVAIGYYGTTAKAKTPDDVVKGQGGWKPYVAVSLNALCQWDAKPCATPTFSQDAIAHQVNHDTNICTSGTTCAADPNANRNLADYFAIDVDKQGHLGFVWSDTTNGTLGPVVKVSRQASGPSLYAGKPAAHLAMRGNGFADATGDALYPISGTKILTAKNQKALDLAGTAVQRASNGDVVVTVKVPGLQSSQTGVVPTGNNGVDDGGTPLQQTRFLTRWDFKGQVYYAEATLSGQEGDVSYGAGSIGTAEALVNPVSPTSYLANGYKGLTPATGTLANGKLVIRVPASAVGSPKTGDRFNSVGSYALVGAQDTATTMLTLPITVDSTPTFDMTFGVATGTVSANPPAAGLPPAIGKPGTSSNGGNGLAATGLPIGVAVLALLLLATGAAVGRRTA